MAANYAKKAGNSDSQRYSQKPYGSRNLNITTHRNPIYSSSELENRQVQSSFASKNRFEVLAEHEGKNPLLDTYSLESPKKSLAKPWTEPLQKRVLDFFTIEGLDRQLRIFNLTKYANRQLNPFLFKQKNFAFSAAKSDLSERTEIEKLQSAPIYIPPHKRGHPAQEKSDFSDENTLIISNQDSEECWLGCQNFGLFAYWNGPKNELTYLMDWLEDQCDCQVSISQYSENLIYLSCGSSNLKKELLKISECFYKGHAIGFFDWIPNCREDNIDITVSSWFILKSFPPELNLLNIIRRIGRSIGNLIGVDATFESNNNLKLLIKHNINNSNPKQLKLITNRATYYFNFQKYDGKISEIISLDDDRVSSFKYLPRTSNLEPYLAKICQNIKKLAKEEQLAEETELKAKQGTDILRNYLKNSGGISENREDENIELDQHFQEEDGKMTEKNLSAAKKHRLQSVIVEKKKDRKTKKRRTNQKKDSKEAIKAETKISKEIGYKDSLENIEDREQVLLFECSAGQDKGQIKENWENQKTDPPMIKETHCAKKLTKFWQTPSPKKKIRENKEGIEEDTIEDIPTKEFLRFLNQKEDLGQSIETENIEEAEIKFIEQLSEELCRVFDPDNDEEDNKTLKEELLKKVLQLGGANYTFMDLRRDLQLFDQEDGSTKEAESEIHDGEQQKDKLELQKDLSDQLLRELVEEPETAKEGITQKEGAESAQENPVQLGIFKNLEGNRHPNYGKTPMKRGRKSLKVLREADGKVREQQKINQLFKKGKGKCLPAES